MKKSIMKQWTKLLRSGEFKQGRLALYNKKDNTHCCLGVLCEMALIKGKCEYETTRYSKNGMFDDRIGLLPESVMKWSGIQNRSGNVIDTSLASLNDSGKTFLEIADFIEKNYKKL